jgi:ketosteroid isomerase-like protein
MATDAARQLDALVARLDLLEAKEAIRELQQAYITGLADRNWNAMIEMFTDDAVTDITWHGERRGRAAILDEFNKIGSMVRSRDGYVLSSPFIEVDGDKATARFTWHRFVADHPMPHGGLQRIWGVWQEGRYRCAYRRENNRWKFSYIHFRSVAPDPDLDERVAAEVKEMAAKRAAQQSAT